MTPPAINIYTLIKHVPDEYPLEIIAGSDGLKNRVITSPRIQKLGLALAGFNHYIHEGRIQIVGQSEIKYLEHLDAEKRRKSILNLELSKIACILITKDLAPPAELIEIANEFQLPILRTSLVSSFAITNITTYLQSELARQITVHGVLMEMYGLGVLMTGVSGIGKSECALDLITRGHRLISDDSVQIKLIGEKLEGNAPELVREHLEIRGLGILNIKELFGVASIGTAKPVDLCIRFVPWEKFENFTRLGNESETEDILGKKIPLVILPVSRGRNLSTLVETAVRAFLLKKTGKNTVQRFIEKHNNILKSSDSE
jgi:HPr kinase/phosphorylase